MKKFLLNSGLLFALVAMCLVSCQKEEILVQEKSLTVEQFVTNMDSDELLQETLTALDVSLEDLMAEAKNAEQTSEEKSKDFCCAINSHEFVSGTSSLDCGYASVYTYHANSSKTILVSISKVYENPDGTYSSIRVGGSKYTPRNQVCFSSRASFAFTVTENDEIYVSTMWIISSTGVCAVSSSSAFLSC